MRFQRQFQAACFNTQPPEGGWVDYLGQLSADDLFQHTAARRRLATGTTTAPCAAAVSTHSRPKAAGTSTVKTASNGNVSTHSRPKAAGPGLISISSGKTVSTHSRPKAAGLLISGGQESIEVSTHSRPKAAGSAAKASGEGDGFQHTAARRRLEPLSKALLHQVSQP